MYNYITLLSIYGVFALYLSAYSSCVHRQIYFEFSFLPSNLKLPVNSLLYLLANFKKLDRREKSIFQPMQNLFPIISAGNIGFNLVNVT